MRKFILTLVLSSMMILGCTTAPPTTTTDAPATDSTPTVIAEVFPVTVEGFQFQPTDLEITVGNTAEWINKDGVSHTITFDEGVVDENLPAGGMVQYTFTEPGEYSYFCQFHPEMRGKVIVR